MTLKEYEKLNAIAMKQQEETMKKDQQYLVENAEELAARLKREQFKKYQKVTQKPQRKNNDEEREEPPSKSYTSIDEAYGAQPVGKWEAVEQEPQQEPEYLDLELPKQNNVFYQPVATVSTDEPPVKKFKEKTITSIDSTDDIPSTFKKRKFGNRNIRRTNNDDG